MKKKNAFPVVCAALAISLSLPAYADVDCMTRSNDFSSNVVAIISAEQQSMGYSGQGKSNTSTLTEPLTQEQLEDDSRQARIDELGDLINETLNEINNGSAQIGDEFGTKTFTDRSTTPINPDYTLPGFEDVVLPDYSLPNWTLPELPDLPEIEWSSITPLPVIEIPQHFGAGEKDINGTILMPITNGYVLLDQVAMPLVQLQTLAGIYGGFHDPVIDTSIPNLTPIVTDKEALIGPITPEYRLELDQDMLDWYKDLLAQWNVDGQKLGGISGILDHSGLGDLEDYFGGQLDIQPIGDIEIGIPTRYDVLYARLSEYIAELQALGQTSVNITRITVYNVQKYSYQCIRKSVPHNDYHWVISGPADSVDTHTQASYLKILFQSPGTYNVDVFNIQDVLRNNKVAGEKTELWCLGESGAYNGLVIYKHSTSFSSFVSDDIGPVTEEVRLIDDSFTANVTEQMLNKIQMIDSSGNIHTPADGFTTERSS